ncbi:BRO family protein [Clostridioides difficile]|uniref:BRO-N domain-containing protein n=1 Tax=Clostridioides difficile TaxID=1496 RepID=UPI00038C6D2B|nr:BRO family protein [Clostridioides difficile]EGT3664860.1 phage repressor protein [Clostridioides difficile]EGT3960305.1 phage repressor protein [Clostridioides difficile]EGT5385336.1 phage repressor protein [Clostridioides difficile]EGT5509721.1 phage repressor protein [Clostridioides difficile]EGT5543036.1 phage repressor protein [Clostridioides difficile]
MMNNLQIFKNEDFGEIRTIDIDNEIWFVGKDVAETLGYANPSKAVSSHVDDDDKIFEMIAHSQNGNMVKTQTALINESGLYSLIFGSKLETAKNFKNWVTKEVLPAIRQTGAYITNNADPDKLREKANEIESLDTVNKTIEILTPFLDNAGIDEKAKLLTAKTIYKKAGIELPLEIEEKEHFFDTVQIATKLNIYSKTNNPAFMAVCEIIKKLDIKEEEKLIVLANKKGWNGTTTKYSQSVIDKIRNWIEENNRPTKIAGEKKNYHVVYKIE